MPWRRLSHPGPIAAEFRNRFDFVIVDEYQDVNYGQQVMLELLAGTRADVMVVGDDDQTIYEWRGARPQYILHEFARRHPNKPHAVYDLTHSFRFGPVIAQCALNTIQFNSGRAAKSLVAQDAAKRTQVVTVADAAEDAADVDKQLADEVAALTDHHHVSPQDIAVLARMYVQLSGLETEFLRRRIPYRIEGNDPFFERREIQALRSYLLAGQSYGDRLSAAMVELFCRVVNSPSRKISSALFRRELESAVSTATTPGAVLERLCDARRSSFSAAQREGLSDFANTLGRLHEWLTDAPPPPAGDVLASLVRMIGLEQGMIELYGDSESAAERLLAVDQFIAYARDTELPPLAFLEHVAGLDPTQGRPEHEQIMMTSIFQTKGLEFDYVIIPHCEEGLLPCLFSSPLLAFDASGTVQPPEMSDSLDNERRLFYVALTRARQVAYLGYSQRPEDGIPAARCPAVAVHRGDATARGDRRHRANPGAGGGGSGRGAEAADRGQQARERGVAARLLAAPLPGRPAGSAGRRASHAGAGRRACRAVHLRAGLRGNEAVPAASDTPPGHVGVRSQEYEAANGSAAVSFSDRIYPGAIQRLRVQQSQQLARTEDGDRLIGAKLEELLVPRAENGRLAAERRGQHQVVLGMGRHSAYLDGQSLKWSRSTSVSRSPPPPRARFAQQSRGRPAYAPVPATCAQKE